MAYNLTGVPTGPVTAGGELSVNDAALQRDLQKLLFGDQGVYSKIAARGIPLTDAEGNMSPEAAYYASVAGTELAGTREQQLAERAQAQQRIDISSRQADVASKALNYQAIGALGGGLGSLTSAGFGKADSPGRSLINYFREKYNAPTPTGETGGATAGARAEILRPDFGASDADLQAMFPGWSMDQIHQYLTTGTTFGVPEGYQLPAELGGWPGLSNAGYTPEDLSLLSYTLPGEEYLGMPMDLGTATGLTDTDMDALLSFLA